MRARAPATSCPLLSTSRMWLLLTAASSPRSLLPRACSSVSWVLQPQGEGRAEANTGGLGQQTPFEGQLSPASCSGAHPERHPK